MSSKYVSRYEIEAHKAAMHRVVKDEKREQEAIKYKKYRAIEKAQRALDEAVKTAEDAADQELKKSRDSKNQKLFAMQKDFSHLPLLRQVYHEAPDDVFELIVSNCSLRYRGGWGLNALRLANKRLKQVVESCTICLTSLLDEDGPDSLPIPIIQRCGRIEEIRCESHNLRSLEGCPDGLQKLWIGDAPYLTDLSRLASCSKMVSLVIQDSSITDISEVASMPLLQVFACQKDPDEGRLSIKDLSPLSSCSQIQKLYFSGNNILEDLSPLSSCAALVKLDITDCPLITSLAPLSTLKSLQRLRCDGISPQISLLPLTLCINLKELRCEENTLDLDELIRRMPQITIDHPKEEQGEEEEEVEEED